MIAYTPDQIKEALAEPGAEGWQLDEHTGEIFREYTFKNFLFSVAFINKLAGVAEELGHHPDILIKYNRVKLSVTTHDANGLTELDFKLAERSNQLAA